MFFVLSKILGHLIRPIVVISGLLLASLIVKNLKWKKRFFITGIILLLFFSNEFIANEVARAWETGVVPFSAIGKKYEYGILLCGVAKGDVGPKDRVYVGSGADRVNHTLYLYKLGHIRKILISGGSGRIIDNGDREADELAKLMYVMGVPTEDIVLENQSKNTHESAVEVEKILKPITTPEKCLLITSAYHMRRSLACFEKVNWHMDPFSADIISHDRTFNLDALIIPKTDALNIWSTILKEWVGYLTYSIMGYI